MMNEKEWTVYDYCIGFIDLLGQREEYKDEGLLPQISHDEERRAFLAKIRRTIGPIVKLQKDADSMMQALFTRNSEDNILPADLKEIYNNLLKNNMKHQRWSDGLVLFSCLHEPDNKSPVNGPFTILLLGGILCLLGLSRRQPIRGGIDIAWGVELHDGELYGAAVAKAYEIESQVAQYPRIVVSDRTIGYLRSHLQHIDNNIYLKRNKKIAEMCINMLTEDVDGNFIIHYLGSSFREYLSQVNHEYLHNEAAKFVQEQYEKHRRTKDNKESNKLSFRYSHLLNYFMAHSLKNNNSI